MAFTLSESGSDATLQPLMQSLGGDDDAADASAASSCDDQDMSAPPDADAASSGQISQVLRQHQAVELPLTTENLQRLDRGTEGHAAGRDSDSSSMRDAPMPFLNLVKLKVDS